METLCKETMISSYRNISFSPERRGEDDYSHYVELLKNDLESLGQNQGNYEKKFVDKVMTIYHRQSRCASIMITGPANFNTNQNRKRVESHLKAINDFEHWRNKYFKAANRVRTLSPEAELDKTLREIDKLIERKETYKEARKLDCPEKTKKLLESAGLLDDKAYWDFDPNGFIKSYTINSLTTKIRERKKKIEIMKRRIETKKNQKPVYFKGGVIFIENDRVIIKHEEKPDQEDRKSVV